MHSVAIKIRSALSRSKMSLKSWPLTFGLFLNLSKLRGARQQNHSLETIHPINFDPPAVEAW